MTLFLVDDTLQIVYNGKVMNMRLKDVLVHGFIIKRSQFMEEFLKFLKTHKIKGKLFGDNIYIIRNSYFNNRDIFFLESLFLELGFLKVIFLDIKELLPDMEATFIEINDTYMVINLDKGIKLDLDYFKDIPYILNYFKDYYKDDIVLFGKNKNIPSIKIKDKNVYYFENYPNCITDSLLKVNNNDV